MTSHKLSPSGERMHPPHSQLPKVNMTRVEIPELRVGMGAPGDAPWPPLSSSVLAVSKERLAVRRGIVPEYRLSLL